jgi:hypothetical protein
LHPQLKDLWRHKPLADSPQLLTWTGGDPGLSVLARVKDQVFAAVVCKELRLSAELDVLFLRAGNAPCSGDLGTEDAPLYTLLEADDLVTRVNVDTARLLGNWPDDHVRVIVRVDVRPTEIIWGNMSFM